MHQKEGVVVVSVFAVLSRDNNLALDSIVRLLPEIRDFNTSSVLRRINFARIMPKDRLLFYRYSGSLTTPPCSQSVRFIILADTIAISPYQVNFIRCF